MNLKTIDLINKEVKRAFRLFENSTFATNFPTPAYWYHEQRTKTFITIALGNVAKGKILQEPGLSRATESPREGRADYYIELNNKRYLIEVKQVWTPVSRLKNPKIFIKRATRELLLQMKDIVHSEWGQDANIGICIAPVFQKKNGLQY